MMCQWVFVLARWNMICKNIFKMFCMMFLSSLYKGTQLWVLSYILYVFLMFGSPDKPFWSVHQCFVYFKLQTLKDIPSHIQLTGSFTSSERDEDHIYSFSFHTTPFSILIVFQFFTLSLVQSRSIGKAHLLEADYTFICFEVHVRCPVTSSGPVRSWWSKMPSLIMASSSLD